MSFIRNALLSALPAALPAILSHYKIDAAKAKFITENLPKALDIARGYGNSREGLRAALAESRLTRDEIKKMLTAAEHPALAAVLNRVAPEAIGIVRDVSRDLSGNPEPVSGSKRVYTPAGRYSPPVNKKKER